MRAAVLSSPGRFEVRTVSIPVPAANEVQVRLEGCGLCTSNIPPFEGRAWFQYPMAPGALGHEGWGIVENVGCDVRDFAPGDRVALLSTHAYAEFDIAAADAVVRLPDSLSAQPFPAEPLGCALNIFHRAFGVAQIYNLRTHEERDFGSCATLTVAIIGIGFLGALLTQLISTSGARVIAISRRPFALELARRFGAADALTESEETTSRVSELTGGALCDVVIECAGKQPALDLAGELTRERGRLVVAGYHQDGSRQVNMQLWNWRGLDVINAHERDPQIYRSGMEAAVHAVESGLLDPRQLYTHTFPLEAINQAFETACNRPDNFMKALVLMQ